MSHPAVERQGMAVTVRVKVHPRAKKDAITGLVGDALKLSLTAPPVDGRANESCVRFFAELYDVPRSAVAIISGANSRTKVVRITGITPEQAEAALTEATDLQ
jgi:uncharacterized protein